jgi:AraC-like DNA-binding protein
MTQDDKSMADPGRPPQARVNTASVAYLKALFDYAQAHDLSMERLLESALPELQDKDARLSESACAALFDRAAQALSDEALGLHVGETIRPGHYGVLGYVAMNCGTLGEALSRLNRYQALVLDIGPMQIQAGSDEVALSWSPDSERPFRQLAEFNLAGLVTFARWISGRAAVPRRIEFNYPAPADLSEHRRIFDCTLVFDCPHYAIVLPQDWLRQPLVQPDAQMRELMLRLADRQMMGLARGTDALAKARALIARRLSEGELALEQVAAGLGMSARTLQRKLKEAGLGYTQLVDNVRRELAEQYLSDASLDLNDLAFLLGFSEQSAFQRAFKRWKGESPGAWRRHLQQAADKGADQ